MKIRVATALLAALAGCGGSGKVETAKAPAAPEFYRIDPATAAPVAGVIRFLGKRPASKVISMDAEEACQKLHSKSVLDAAIAVSRDGGLANVFVYVKSGLEGRVFEPSKEAVVLDQRGCQFLPRVIALRAGQTFNVRNSDPVSHSIHPVPKNNREWNQQQPPQAADLERRFAIPEVMIPVKCNVHSWMRSWIGVLDHPYFAVTGPNGEFEWRHTPPGDYTVAAWHESLGEQTQTVRVKAGEGVKLSFAFR